MPLRKCPVAKKSPGTGEAPRIGSPSGVPGRSPAQAVTKRAAAIDGTSRRGRGQQHLDRPCGDFLPEADELDGRAEEHRAVRARYDDRPHPSTPGRKRLARGTHLHDLTADGLDRNGGKPGSKAAQAPAASTTAGAWNGPPSSRRRGRRRSRRESESRGARDEPGAAPLGRQPGRAGQQAGVDGALVRKEHGPGDVRREPAAQNLLEPGARTILDGEAALALPAVGLAIALEGGRVEGALPESHPAVARRRSPSPRTGSATRPGRARGSRAPDRRRPRRARLGLGRRASRRRRRRLPPPARRARSR